MPTTSQHIRAQYMTPCIQDDLGILVTMALAWHKYPAEGATLCDGVISHITYIQIERKNYYLKQFKGFSQEFLLKWVFQENDDKPNGNGKVFYLIKFLLTYLDYLARSGLVSTLN